MGLDKKDHDSLYAGYSYGMETLADYKHGGYHPVNINDRLGEGDRYELIRKLAHGTHATVWLATDLQEKKYVALKIMTGKVSRKADKTPILDEIAKATKGAPHIVQEKEHFKFKGPNGNHIVSVQEVMGPDVEMFWHVIQDKRFAKKMDKLKLPIAKSILRQVLQAVEVFHKNNIAHGNIEMSNVMLELEEGLDDVSHTYLELRLSAEKDQLIEPPKKQKGLPDQVVISVPLHKYVKIDDQEEGVHVKLGDINASFDVKNPPSDGSLATPRSRAPELVLGGDNINLGVDIWSLGVMIFEIVCGRRMFDLQKTKAKEQDDELLFQMNSILGTIPEDLAKKWKPSNAFKQYVKDGKVEVPPEYKHTPTLDTHFDNWRPDAVNKAEATQIKTLLHKIFQYDVAKRPSVTEIINDPWLKA
ncbi:hypothetical protein TRVA0_009S01178 [Trichomonascus vanleenenianus]|uniref:uncharacterized protein n=1 Tax=Trichomonascus vanleenenianus TaxID=2268995 RepID=UPI003EC97055